MHATYVILEFAGGVTSFYRTLRQQCSRVYLVHVWSKSSGLKYQWLFRSSKIKIFKSSFVLEHMSCFESYEEG
jgi:hypothetical protein